MIDGIESKVRALLGNIATDSDLSAVAPDCDLREELDIDSMDILHFAIALSEVFGIGVLERDYRRLSTIESTVAFVEERIKETERRTVRNGD